MTSTRRLRAFIHMTLDGFIATPEGVFWGRFPWGEREMEWNNEQFNSADTWVLGRTMYETIIPWWTSVGVGDLPDDVSEISSADEAFGRMVVQMRKVVISRTLETDESRLVIADDPARRLEELKQMTGGDLMLSCGPALLSELARAPGLIDEYNLIVHPAAIGAGTRLFSPEVGEVQLQLTGEKRFDGGALALRYLPFVEST